MPEQDIRLAVIGTRNIGKGHIQRCAQAPGISCVAIAEPQEDRRRAIAEEFGIPKAYADADACFADPEIDAVVLALPNHLHAPMSIAAMRAGKHVLVEKPMAATVAEAEAMKAVAEETGQVLMVGMNQRFSPSAAGLRRLYAGGELGAVQHVHAWWLQAEPGKGLWQRGDWFLSNAHSGGGPLIDLGVHKLDLALFILGYPEVTHVTATCHYGIGREAAQGRGKMYEIEDGADVFLKLSGGGSLFLQASYFAGLLHGGSQDVVIHGTKGGAQHSLDSWRPCAGEQQSIPQDGQAARSCVEHFSRVLHGHEALSSTPEQGLILQRIIAAAYESAATGTEIALAEVCA